MNTTLRLGRLLRNLPLFFKLLLPFILLLSVVGSAGTFLLVRQEAAQAQQSLDRQLAQRSLDIRNALHDREVYVEESANLAANLQGVAQAVQQHDSALATRLLESVMALKTDLTLVTVTDARGRAVAELSRPGPGLRPRRDPTESYAEQDYVTAVLHSGHEATSGALLDGGSQPAKILVSTTLCAGTSGCRVVGSALAAADAGAAVTSLSRAGAVTLYDGRGVAVATSDRQALPRLPDAVVTGSDFVRVRTGSGSTSVATLYSPYTIQGRRVGVLAVSLPAGRTRGAARSTAWRIAAVALALMLGIMLIGASLSRYLLGQVRRLLDTHQALGAGDLTARVDIDSTDELGRLAAGVNAMAEALQTTHETLEARVADRTAEVERLLRDRTEFFTALSHEFRTPLAVILGQAKLLSDGRLQPDAAWRSRSGRIITDSAQQLLGFVNDIVDIAKLEAGAVDVTLRPVQPATVLRRLAPALETLGQQAGVSVKLRIGRSLPAVQGDETFLREIVFNLADNAMKYTPAGGRVEVTARRLDSGAGTSGVEIAVTDTGLGIPESEQPQLFSAFYRVKGNEPQAGQPSSGLGLALTRRLVEALGGTIAVVSEPGQGSTFTVTLIAAAGSGDEPDQGPARDVESSAEGVPRQTPSQRDALRGVGS